MNNGKTLAQQAAERDKGREQLGRREGDHVFLYQDRAEADGFRNISKPWWEKTLPVDDVVQRLVSDAEECVDLEVSASDIQLDEDGTISLDGERLSFSTLAYGNLCEWAKLPGGIREALLSQGDAEGKRLFSEAVNRGFRFYQYDRENNIKLRLRGTTVRAVVSDQYSSIENSWALETLSKIVKGGRVSHFRYNGDDVSGLLLIPDTIREEKDSDYGGGIHFKNSEVGSATLFMRPSVFRSICMNGCIWGELKGTSYISKRHRGSIDFNEVASDMAHNVNTQIPLTTVCIDKMLKTRSVEIGNRIECLRVVAAISPSKGVTLTQNLRRAWVDGWVEEGAEDTSAFGLLQGLTRAARDCRDSTNALSLETLAGELFDKDQTFWSFERENAERRVTDEEMIRVLSEPLIREALA